jgi:tetratricopeptide (TPR) repeat protein
MFISVPGISSPDALLLLQNGHADQALQLLNSQIQANPNDARAYNLMARVYFQLEQWDDAIRAEEKAVAQAPNNSEYHQWLGRIYGEKAETVGKVHFVSAISLVRKVKAEFERAVALDPEGKNLSARADLAEFYTEAPSIMGGDKAKAKSLAEFVMKQDAALAHYMLARIEEKQNAKDRAEQEYKAAIEASNDLARYWISLGSFYRRTGRLNEMQASVMKSVSARREQGIALFDGASLLLNAGRDFPDAIKMFREYLSVDDPVEDGPAFQAHYLVGMLLEKQGDPKAAAQEYRAALALAAEYQPAQEALARVTR